MTLWTLILLSGRSAGRKKKRVAGVNVRNKNGADGGLLCKAVLISRSNAFLNWSDMSSGKYTACVFRNALQCTTAHLQVLFSFVTLRQNN